MGEGLYTSVSQPPGRGLIKVENHCSIRDPTLGCLWNADALLVQTLKDFIKLFQLPPVASPR
jgi:hypothetical protein